MPATQGSDPQHQRPETAETLAGLTKPQAQAVLHTEGALLVLAGPGSGKTRVITRRIAYLVQCGIPPWQVLALTFTNKAAAEMRERVHRLLGEGAAVRGLTVTTFHALCARLLRKYADIARLPGLTGNFVIYDTDDQTKLLKRAIEGLDLSTTNWPARSVLSRISDAKNNLIDAAAFAAQQSDFYGRTLAKIYEAYQKGLRAADAVDFDDLLVLTAQMLKHNADVREACRARWQYLLVDEYQDTNKAQFVIAALLAGEKNPNICVVGDPDQCLPPGTMVTTPDGSRPIETLAAGDRVVTGIGWGATAPGVVEAVATRHYRGPLVRARTADGAVVSGTPGHMVFGRLQPRPDLHYAYLMWKRGVGYRVGLTRGVRASKDGEIVSGLQVRTNQEVADAMWILHATRSPAEARFYEHYYSVKYGIPSMVFFVRGRRMEITQDWIDKLYREIDTEEAASRLMADLDLDPRFPHHRPGAVTRFTTRDSAGWSRRHVLFTAFGGPRRVAARAWHEHRVQLVTSDVGARAAATAAKFNVRDGVRGTWRIETSRKEYDEGLELAGEIASLMEGMEIIQRARLTPNRSFLCMPLSHLRIGMVVPIFRGGEVIESTVEFVELTQHDGPVYDLTIPHTRNYIAGGFVVHNSIYGWRGADIGNILDFEKQFPNATVIALGENFRSTKHIIGAADRLIRRNTRRKHKDLFTANAQGHKVEVTMCRDEHHEAGVVLHWLKARREDSGDGEGGAPLPWKDMAVFYRTNALSRVVEDALRNEGIPYVIARGTAFYQREEVKHALAYLRVIANPADEVSLGRIINVPARGIGDTTLGKIEAWGAEAGVPLFEALRLSAVGRGAELGPKAAGAIGKFVGLIDAWRGAAPATPDGHLEMEKNRELRGSLASLVERVVSESGLEDSYRKGKTETDEERIENLAELVSSAQEFEQSYEPGSDPVVDVQPDGQPATEAGAQADKHAIGVLGMLRAYLERVTLVSDADAVDPAQGAVTLMTLHAAKGLEFPAVAMIGLEEGVLPHSRVAESPAELEEERRLCFVGITRAMRRLLITTSRYRTVRGISDRTIPSRFLEELPGEHVSKSDQSDWREPGWDTDGDPSSRPGAPRSHSAGGFGGSSGSARVRDARGQELRVGVRVRHPQFGVGEIIGLTGGGDARAQVRFREVGVKTLVLQYARLERLD